MIRRIGRRDRAGEQLYPESWPDREDVHLQNVQTPTVPVWHGVGESRCSHKFHSFTVIPAQLWIKSAGVTHYVLRTLTNLDSVQLQILDLKAIRASGPDEQGRTQKDRGSWKDFVCKNGLFPITQRVCTVNHFHMPQHLRRKVLRKEYSWKPDQPCLRSMLCLSYWIWLCIKLDWPLP